MSDPVASTTAEVDEGSDMPLSSQLPTPQLDPHSTVVCADPHAQPPNETSTADNNHARANMDNETIDLTSPSPAPRNEVSLLSDASEDAPQPQPFNKSKLLDDVDDLDNLINNESKNMQDMDELYDTTNDDTHTMSMPHEQQHRFPLNASDAPNFGLTFPVAPTDGHEEQHESGDKVQPGASQTDQVNADSNEANEVEEVSKEMNVVVSVPMADNDTDANADIQQQQPTSSTATLQQRQTEVSSQEVENAPTIQLEEEEGEEKEQRQIENSGESTNQQESMAVTTDNNTDADTSMEIAQTGMNVGTQDSQPNESHIASGAPDEPLAAAKEGEPAPSPVPDTPIRYPSPVPTPVADSTNDDAPAEVEKKENDESTLAPVPVSTSSLFNSTGEKNEDITPEDDETAQPTSGTKLPSSSPNNTDNEIITFGTSVTALTPTNDKDISSDTQMTDATMNIDPSTNTSPSPANPEVEKPEQVTIELEQQDEVIEVEGSETVAPSNEETPGKEGGEQLNEVGEESQVSSENKRASEEIEHSEQQQEPPSEEQQQHTSTTEPEPEAKDANKIEESDATVSDEIGTERSLRESEPKSEAASDIEVNSGEAKTNDTFRTNESLGTDKSVVADTSPEDEAGAHGTEIISSDNQEVEVMDVDFEQEKDTTSVDKEVEEVEAKSDSVMVLEKSTSYESVSSKSSFGESSETDIEKKESAGETDGDAMEVEEKEKEKEGHQSEGEIVKKPDDECSDKAPSGTEEVDKLKGKEGEETTKEVTKESSNDSQVEAKQPVKDDTDGTKDGEKDVVKDSAESGEHGDDDTAKAKVVDNEDDKKEIIAVKPALSKEAGSNKEKKPIKRVTFSDKSPEEFIISPDNSEPAVQPAMPASVPAPPASLTATQDSGSTIPLKQKEEEIDDDNAQQEVSETKTADGFRKVEVTNVTLSLKSKEDPHPKRRASIFRVRLFIRNGNTSEFEILNSNDPDSGCWALLSPLNGIIHIRKVRKPAYVMSAIMYEDMNGRLKEDRRFYIHLQRQSYEKMFPLCEYYLMQVPSKLKNNSGLATIVPPVSGSNLDGTVSQLEKGSNNNGKDVSNVVNNEGKASAEGSSIHRLGGTKRNVDSLSGGKGTTTDLQQQQSGKKVKVDNSNPSSMEEKKKLNNQKLLEKRNLLLAKLGKASSKAGGSGIGGKPSTSLSDEKKTDDMKISPASSMPKPDTSVFSSKNISNSSSKSMGGTFGDIKGNASTMNAPFGFGTMKKSSGTIPPFQKVDESKENPTAFNSIKPSTSGLAQRSTPSSIASAKAKPVWGVKNPSNLKPGLKSTPSTRTSMVSNAAGTASGSSLRPRPSILKTVKMRTPPSFDKSEILQELAKDQQKRDETLAKERKKVEDEFEKYKKDFKESADKTQKEYNEKRNADILKILSWTVSNMMADLNNQVPKKLDVQSNNALCTADANSKDDFLARLDTFGVLTWNECAYPSPIDPLECAVRGWYNSACDTLKSTDGAEIVADANALRDIDLRDEEVKRIRSLIEGKGHKLLSKWIGQSCPYDFREIAKPKVDAWTRD